jgi:type IV pilus assembly protein PilX
MMRCPGPVVRARLRRPASLLRRAQRGVVLFIALIMLVAMTLTGLALSHSVTTSVLVAGNLGFQQGATSSGDAGIEAARTWLIVQGSDTLRVDGLPGYLSNWDTTFNPATFNWATNATPVGTDAGGNTVSYIIHRLCSTSGLTANAPLQQCVTLQLTGATGSKGGASYGSLPLTGVTYVYYRITARTAGPRNTVSYVQAILY